MLNDKERFLLECIAFTEGGIRIDETFRTTINTLQERRLIYIENRIMRCTYKGFCFLNISSNRVLANCVLIPRHISSVYLHGKPLNEQYKYKNW